MMNKKKSLALLTVIVMVAVLCVSPASAALTGSTNSTVVFTAGALALTAVPTFDFGTQNISSNDATYNSMTITNQITIEDLRGSGAGWNLTAQLSAFTNSSVPSLAGASMAFTPVAAPIGGTLGGANSPTASAVTLISGNASATPVMGAVLGTGKGTWNGNVSAATLTVIGSTAAAGTNTASLSWVLSDTP